MRSDERRSAGAFVNFRASRAAQVHASLLYMKDATYSQFYPYINTAGVPAGGFQINCRNPFLSASQAALLCGSAAGSNQLVSTEYTAIMGGPGSRPLRAEAINQDYRISLGVDGEVFDHWRYDLSAIRSTVFSSLSDSNEIDPTRLNNASERRAGRWNPDLRRQAHRNRSRLRSGRHLPAERRRSALLRLRLSRLCLGQPLRPDRPDRQPVGDLTGYGVKSPWAERGLAVALGVEYRADSLKQKIDAATLAFEQLGPPLRGRQSVYEVYGELQAPIAEGRPWIERLEVNAGVRYSKYSTDDDLLATRKYELQYQPTPDWLVRASLNKAARAPNISELYTGSAYGVIGLSDPCSGAAPTASLDACQRTGVTAAQYGHIPDCPDQLCQTYGGNGNRSLRPENARTRTIGLVYTPRALPGFSVSADYYRIAVKGYIGPILADSVFQNCLSTGGDYYCQFVHRAADTGACSAARRPAGTSPPAPRTPRC
jgi:iron complex outermembrane receptor protein